MISINKSTMVAFLLVASSASGEAVDSKNLRGLSPFQGGTAMVGSSFHIDKDFAGVAAGSTSLHIEKDFGVAAGAATDDHENNDDIYTDGTGEGTGEAAAADTGASFQGGTAMLAGASFQGGTAMLAGSTSLHIEKDFGVAAAEVHHAP